MMLRRRSARFRPGLALSASILLLLTACLAPGGGGGVTPFPDEDADAAPEGALEEAADEAAPDGAGDTDDGDDEGSELAAEAEESGLSIRDIDLAELEWREAITEQHLTPARAPGPFQYAIAETIAYADVDGDGHDDALVGLEITEEQWFEQIWYIWTWDEQAQTAVQVENPIARMARCGDTVLEVAAADGAFAITEALRTQGDTTLDCASDGHIEFTRHVTLEDGWPVLTGEVQGHGGICPQPAPTDNLFPAEDYELRTGPVETMTALTDPAPLGYAEVDTSGHLWLFREHWMLVNVTTEQPVESRGGYVPCAWVFLEEDARPIPHDPYLPEE